MKRLQANWTGRCGWAACHPCPGRSGMGAVDPADDGPELGRPDGDTEMFVHGRHKPPEEIRSGREGADGDGEMMRTAAGDHVAAETFGGLSRSVSRLSETPSAATFTESRARWA